MVEESGSGESWAFPDINSKQVFTPELNIVHTNHEQMNDRSPEDKDAVIKILREENEKLALDLQTISAKNSESSLINQAIIERLNDASSYIDDEIVDLIKYFIKSITEKITRKAFDQDIAVLDELIKQLKSYVDAHSGPVTIFVSEIDLQKFQNNKNPLGEILKADKMLNVGDIIIRSNCTEIRALVSESIDKLLG